MFPASLSNSKVFNKREKMELNASMFYLSFFFFFNLWAQLGNTESKMCVFYPAFDKTQKHNLYLHYYYIIGDSEPGACLLRNCLKLDNFLKSCSSHKECTGQRKLLVWQGVLGLSLVQTGGPQFPELQVGCRGRELIDFYTMLPYFEAVRSYLMAVLCKEPPKTKDLCCTSTLKHVEVQQRGVCAQHVTNICQVLIQCASLIFQL